MRDDNTKLRDRAYSSFTERLLAREIRPGQFVSQRELVEITGMPLGAIRELIPRLEAEGLITTVPQRGLFAAETAFTNSDCTRAIEVFTNYISKFKKGFFLQDAHFNRADCLLKTKQYAQILEDYDYLIANAAELKERALLNASGISFFELKDYKKATQYYIQLENIATTPQNRYTAILGQYKSAQKLEDQQAILTTADKVLNLTGAKEGDLIDAHFTKAKTLYSLKNNEQAFIHFQK